ncbi:MAG: electron transport complex subunit E [Clostridiales bacterium]|nr:electron transport complex subunit E [Clostridiales bacterium]
MKNKYINAIYNGLIKENPTFVLMLGMCPTLAVTTSAINGIGMGLSTTAVLMMSNLLIGCLRNIIPDKVRIPSYIVIIASFVTIVQLLLQAFVPSVYSALGIYIPLIVVNCIIFGRAEAFASKNSGPLSFCDGIGMGLGFTWAITVIGLVREFLGAGTLFGIEVLTKIPGFEPIAIFIMAPGAFFVLAILTALQNKFKAPSATNTDTGCDSIACGGNCAACSGSVFVANKELLDKAKAEEEAKKAAEKAAKAAAAKAKKEAEAASKTEE